MPAAPKPAEAGSAQVRPAVVFDACPVFRDGLASLIASRKAHFSSCERTSDARQAFALAAARPGCLVAVDLDAGAAGLELLQRLKQSAPPCCCVALITDGSHSELMAAIRMQADGFLSKREEPEQIIGQIEQISRGEMIISESLTNALASSLRSIPDPGDMRDISALSAREAEVLRCIARGMSNRAIAEQLSISDGTVKVHVKHVLKKLSFSSRVEAALWASDAERRRSAS
ncbi:MAG: response regulator [Duodenibacillus sp.]|nr:response regulator [Duodenibacillus sp.]